MARSAEEAALEYKQALEDLKDNNKMQINLMTILADDYNSYSKEIVDVIAQQIKKVLPPQKLAVMYVMDSILKNITAAGNYKRHIEKIVHSIFVHTFDAGDERTRLALHKLRQTWTGIFQRATLYKMDVSVHEIDPAWPVITPLPSNQAQAPSTSPGPSVDSAQVRGGSRVHVNPHFLQKNNENRQLTGKVVEKRTNLDPRLAKFQNQGNGSPKTDVETATALASRGKMPVEESLEMVGDVDERNLIQKNDEGSKSRRENEFNGIERKFDGTKRKAEEENEISEKKMRMNRLAVIRDMPSLHVGGTSTTFIRPTNDLGSHAFLNPRLATALPFAANPTNFIPQVVPVVPTTSTHHLISDATSKATGLNLLISPAVNEADAGRRPFAIVPPITPSQIPPRAPAHVITSETPRFDGIPANNRIFVDGHAYEVRFIDDIPVIERNSLPHRIYFTGAPRNVVIDGLAYLMKFGEEKKVLIDGEEHILRFGAPSRELYMGNYPFKGAFGGPPIFATINGVRHEIRLCGPPPEVKIEPDPCYELLRHMPRTGLNTSQSASNLTANTELSSVDVKGLLEKLQKSGFLPSSNANKRKEVPEEPPKAPTPPIPSAYRGEVTEKLPKPPTDLKQFSIRSLRIRYDSVIESLHEKRQLCPNCGLRFSDLSQEEYQNHLDWHIRENLKSSTSSKCRPWYVVDEEWLEFSERDALLSTNSRLNDRNLVQDQGGKEANMNVPCNILSLQECGVCKEKFEEYWDEDDDTWKFKDCVLGDDGRGFHPGCLLDATSVSIKNFDEPASEEDHCDDSALIKIASEKLKKNIEVL